MNKRILRVGLDLDGVILYNPARVVRPLVVGAKKLFVKKKAGTFYIPKGRFQKWMWVMLHKSSLFVAPGLKDFIEYAKDNNIELYIVSGRYSFLTLDLEKWVAKIGGKDSFSGYFNNKDDEQPYLFKEKAIKKLKLDVFVEDNWDIVAHLAPKNEALIVWLANVLDKKIDYPYKFYSMRQVISFLKHDFKPR